MSKESKFSANGKFASVREDIINAWEAGKKYRIIQDYIGMYGGHITLFDLADAIFQDICRCEDRASEEIGE